MEEIETGMKQLEHVNAMPAPTWHFLKMNYVDIEVPGGLAATPAVTSAVSEDALAPDGAFEYALATLQGWREAMRLAPETLQDGGETKPPADTRDDYGETAKSAYQLRADAMEAADSLEESFETGVGAPASALLRAAAGSPIVVSAAEGQTAHARITVMGVDGAFSAAAVDVVAGVNSTVNLDLVVDSPDVPESASGFTGTTVRIAAGYGATVNIRRMQTLDPGFDDIDDLGIVAMDDARVRVDQTVLGGNRTFTGLACDLRGRGARIGVGLRYVGHGRQRHDMNYVVRHHGRQTESDIQANGVLSGTSRKTLRGTIDLIRGCKGARGNERETVLLADTDVQNRTVPVILCNEDDVAGNHGATIGHVNAEQLRYLQARGLSESLVEALFLEAPFAAAVQDAPSEQAAAGADRLARRVLGRSVLLQDFEGREA